MLYLEHAKNKFKPLGATVSELPLRVVVTILECCVTFSGVKLSIRSFVLLHSLILNSICQDKIGAILLTLHKQMMKTLLKVVFVNISFKLWICFGYVLVVQFTSKHLRGNEKSFICQEFFT